MTWRQFARAVQADLRRAERASARRQRGYERRRVSHARAADREQRERAKRVERRERELAKLAEKERARSEVEEFENYLEFLVSLHKECGDPWDWKGFASISPPRQPLRPSFREEGARDALAGYQPGFFTRLFGQDKKVRSVLEDALERAKAEDLAQHQEEMRQYEAEHALWRERRTLATGILARDPAIYRAALQHASCEEVVALGIRISFVTAEADVVALTCHLPEAEVVPTEEMKLTAAEKVTSKAMPAGRYWLLYQDFVCSCALRIARETFAILPVKRVIVSMAERSVDSSTGHPASHTLVTVHVTRAGLAALNLDSVDPSDTLNNFPHTMEV